jgi:hypothetical protein
MLLVSFVSFLVSQMNILQLVFWPKVVVVRSRVEISVRRPDNLTEGVRSFPQSLQTNAGIVT